MSFRRAGEHPGGRHRRALSSSASSQTRSAPRCSPTHPHQGARLRPGPHRVARPAHPHGPALRVVRRQRSDPRRPPEPGQLHPGRAHRRPQNTTAKLALAPRLGVSFPVLDRASVFFSYGHFYQLPGLGHLLLQRRLLDPPRPPGRRRGATACSAIRTSSPSSRPSTSSASRARSRRSLGARPERSSTRTSATCSASSSCRPTPPPSTPASPTSTSAACAASRSSLDQRGPGALATTSTTRYQIATGNASDPRETANRAAAGADPRPRQVPFNWDQRHTLNATAV